MKTRTIEMKLRVDDKFEKWFNARRLELLALATQRMSAMFFDSVGGVWGKRAFYCLSPMLGNDNRIDWLRDKAETVLFDNGYHKNDYDNLGVSYTLKGE